MRAHWLPLAVALSGCDGPSEATAVVVHDGGGAPRWIAVRGLEDCAVERLEGDASDFVESWHSCAEGCRTRAAVPRALPHHVAERSSSAAQSVDGELVLRTSLTGPDWRYEILERATADAPELVLRMSNECHVTAQKTGAALLVEMFRDPAEHFVAVTSIATGSIAVHPAPVGVRLPIAGWFVEGATWGMIDGAGVHVAADGELETVVRSSDWLLAPRMNDGELAWIDWGRAPATVMQSSGPVGHGDHDVAAFSDPSGGGAWLEVDGPDTLTGRYDAATLHWPEGRVDLSGRVASAIRVGLDDDHVGLTTPGDGNGIAPAFIRVDRESGHIELDEPPSGRFWKLAGNGAGRWLLQDVSAAAPSQFDAWILR